MTFAALQTIHSILEKAEDGYQYLVQLGIDPDVKTVDLFPE